MYKKIYLEITNICNLDCSFCHKTTRPKGFLSEEDFCLLLQKIKGHTKYLYFHLMGEPLLHPDLGAFLKKAQEEDFKVTIATNGFLIKEKERELLHTPPYKVTFSLHSFEANSNKISLGDYLDNITDFCKKAEKNGTICVLRLWNEGGENSLNEEILQHLKKQFQFSLNRKGYTLSDRIYLESAQKFIWPDIKAPEQKVRFCMGLRDHIGILCDGSVVPCCLDADGSAVLGNLFRDSLQDITSCRRAKSIFDGFSQGRATEELCRRCQYATRFNTGH